MKYANYKNNIVTVFNTLPNFYINEDGKKIDGFQYASEETLKANKIYPIYFPVKTENQKYESLNNISQSWFNAGTEMYVVPLIDLPLPTAQELYDALIIEGKQVFEDFRNELAKAASPYTILGTIPIELKQLTQAMLDAKVRILQGLDYYLANNDIENLKNFSYQTEEAEQLKQAIENFK